MNLNHIYLAGRLGTIPELRYTQSGKAVTTLSLATNKNVKNGDQWDTYTDWHSIIVWGELAERVIQKAVKGSEVFIFGELRYRKYKPTDYNKDIKVAEIVAHQVKFTGIQASESSDSSQQNSGSGDDEDLPF